MHARDRYSEPIMTRWDDRVFALMNDETNAKASTRPVTYFVQITMLPQSVIPS